MKQTFKENILKIFTVIRCPLLMPFSLKFIYPIFRDKEFKLLDIGCGNHSPALTKKFFPKVKYFGLSKEIYNLDEKDLAVMDEFFKIDLSDIRQLCKIPDNSFNVIVMSHVLEHIKNGLEVIKIMVQKVKDGGYLYIEYPGVRSLYLPSMKGTLNFFDDRTHLRLYSLSEVINTLSEKEISFLSYGVRRDPWRIILLPLIAIYCKLKDGYFSGGIFWDLLGFADFIFVKKSV